MTITWHPQLDENGNPKRIHHPSTASDIAMAGYPDQVATFLLGSAVPPSLNGIALSPWADVPSSLDGWRDVAGQADIVEPKLALNGHKKAAAGVVIEEPDGRIWVVSPTNAFGGYQQTFPKGKANAGLKL